MLFLHHSVAVRGGGGGSLGGCQLGGGCGGVRLRVPEIRVEGEGESGGDELRRKVERRRVRGLFDGEDDWRVLVEGKLRGER